MPRKGHVDLTQEQMFHSLARYYDLLASQKDYRAEATFVGELAERYSRAPVHDWLDVACGTGRHLEYLRARYNAVGVDLSEEMLDIARRRLPGVELHQGDMRNFRLRRRFDAVTCLYSAIGHLGSERELQGVFKNFARHLRAGGVVIVEPWLSPQLFREGFVNVVSAQEPGLAVSRMALSKRRGNHSLVEYHYLIGSEDKGIRYVRDTNRGLLVPPSRLLQMLKGAGFLPRFRKQGLSPGRGLLIGVKT